MKSWRNGTTYSKEKSVKTPISFSGGYHVEFAPLLVLVTFGIILLSPGEDMVSDMSRSLTGGLRQMSVRLPAEALLFPVTPCISTRG